MTEVIAIRVSKELKEQLKESGIDYADEIRVHLEQMIKRNKLKKIKNEIDAFRKNLGRETGITSNSADIIRRDREHAH